MRWAAPRTRVQAKGGRPFPAVRPCLSRGCCRGLVDRYSRVRECTLPVPILVEDRPQRLIEVLAVLLERLAKHPFLHRTELAERAVAAAVADRGARLEAMHTDLLEREAHDQLRAFLEHAGAPVRRSDRKAPLGRPEAGLQL